MNNGNTPQSGNGLLWQMLSAPARNPFSFLKSQNIDPTTGAVTRLTSGSKGVIGGTDAAVPPGIKADAAAHPYQPSTAVKNITTPDGTSTTFHPPAAPGSPAAAAAQQTKDMQTYFPTATKPAPPVAASSPVVPPPVQTPPAGSGSTVGQAPDTSSKDPYGNSLNTQQTYASGQGTPTVNAAIGGLAGIAANQTPAVLEAERQYNEAADNPYMIGALTNSAMAESVSAGAGQRFAQNYQNILASKAAEVNQAIQGEGQQITAGNEAGQMGQAQTGAQQAAAANVGSLTQPQANAPYFGSPVTGSPVGGGNDLISTGVQQAILMASQPGTDPTALRANLVSQYGPGAGQQFDQAMINKSGGAYSPGAASASAQQTSGQGATLGGQAKNLSVAVQQVETIAPLVTSILSNKSLGINSTDSPLFNAAINTYQSQIQNAGAMAEYNALVNSVQKFSSQIISQGSGGTPTMVSLATQLQDPSKLSLNQIVSYLSTIKADGNNQIAVLQSQARQSGYTGDMGTPVGVTTTAPTPPSSTGLGSGLTSTTGQAVAGATLGAFGEVSNFAGELLGFLGGKLLTK